VLRPRTSATPNLTLDSEGKCESDVIGAFFHWKMPASQCRSNCETFKCDFKVPKRYCSLKNNVSVGFMQSMLSTHTSKAMRPCLRGGGVGGGQIHPLYDSVESYQNLRNPAFFQSDTIGAIHFHGKNAICWLLSLILFSGWVLLRGHTPVYLGVQMEAAHPQV